MKTIAQRCVFYLIIVALVGGLMGEVVYTNDREDCPCCTANKCHANTKCHDTAKACLCKHQTVQAFLPETNILLKFVFAGYLQQNLHFTYLYLSTDDIFHPPRV